MGTVKVLQLNVFLSTVTIAGVAEDGRHPPGVKEKEKQRRYGNTMVQYGVHAHCVAVYFAVSSFLYTYTGLVWAKKLSVVGAPSRACSITNGVITIYSKAKLSKKSTLISLSWRCMEYIGQK